MKRLPLLSLFPLALAASLVLVVVLVRPGAQASPDATITVNSIADTNSRDGALTLREAVLLATGGLAVDILDGGECAQVSNSTYGPPCSTTDSIGAASADTIDFDTGEFNPGTINLSGGLPTLSTGNDIINGTAGSVIIDGPGSGECFEITSDNNVIRGLEIYDCQFGVAVEDGGQANVIGGTNVDNDGDTLFGEDPVDTTDNDGDTLTDEDTLDVGNVISGHSYYGVVIWDADSDNNIIKGNYVGTDAAGTGAIPNGGGSYYGSGIVISQAHGTIVGGETPGERNIISGNHPGWGVFISSGASGNTVKGNYIGTDATGTVILGNGTGVQVGSYTLGGSAHANTIGGSGAGQGNLISGNESYGVAIENSGSTGNVVQGNHIGLDAAGADIGVNISYGAHHNIIGGSSPGEGNVISNHDTGVKIKDADTHGNTIQGNYIGTDPSGTVAVANRWGIVIENGAHDNTVGGSSAGEGNVVSGNEYAGVLIGGSGTNGNVVQGNYIGPKADGIQGLGNGTDGVWIDNSAQTSSIGGMGAGEGNIIAFNGGNGVRVEDSTTTGNEIRANSIHNNTGRGIENTGGGNHELAPPTIAGVDSVVTGTCAFTECDVDVFSDYRDEGRVYQGSVNDADDGTLDGNWTFPGEIEGPRVTATATDPATGDTSEFSALYEISLPAGTVDLATVSLHLTVYGADPEDYLSGGATGDYNDDGLDDVLLIAQGDGPGNGRAGAGEAYVISGSTAAGRTVDIALGEQDVTIYGAEAGDALGGQVAGRGDFNGDGVDDILIGAPGADGPGNARSGAGEAYIIFGSGTLGGTVDIALGDQDVTIYGAEAGDVVGRSVATGDLNGDTVKDILLSAPGGDGPGNARSYAGEAYVILGPIAAGTVDLALGEQDLTIYGAEASDQAFIGFGVGDLNGDTIEDIVATAPVADGPGNARDDAGEAYVIFGSLSLGGSVDLALGEQDLTVYGADEVDYMGLAPPAVGDVNDDGIDDFLVGTGGDAAGPGNHRPLAGEAYVIFGRETLGGSVDTALAEQDLTIYGADPWGELLGYRPPAIGDVNGDGIDDILVGAIRGSEPGGAKSWAGKVYVIFGPVTAGTVDTALYQQDATFLGVDAYDCLGGAWVADFDGDNVGDIVLSARWADGPENGREQAGEMYALLGGDGDSDGIENFLDNCPGTPNPGQDNDVHAGTPEGDHCEDPDADSVFDIDDNCPDTYNPDQTNTDVMVKPPGDANGDACDPDDDNDTVLDGADASPLDPYVCQDVDTDTCDDCSVLGLPDLSDDGTDTDSDGACDAGDPDDDNDAWVDGDEGVIGTDPLDNCTDQLGDNDAWPPDLARAGGCRTQDTVVNILDVTCYKPKLPPNPYDPRYDLDASGAVTILDILMYKPLLGTSCTNP